MESMQLLYGGPVMFAVTYLEYKAIAVVATEFERTVMRTLEYVYAYLYAS